MTGWSLKVKLNMLILISNNSVVSKKKNILKENRGQLPFLLTGNLFDPGFFLTFNINRSRVA